MGTIGKQLETALIATLDSTPGSMSAIIGMLRIIATDRMYQTSRGVAERQAWSAWEHALGQLNTSGFVGGYIEMVPCKLSHRALIVNEDGLGLELQHNVKASEYVAEGVMVLDLIRGNALLIKWM